MSKNNSSTRQKYRDSGSCAWCPAPRHYSDNLDRHLTLCTKHHEQERANKARRLQRLRDEGKCHDCGQITNTSYSRCDKCRAKMAS